MLELDPDMDDAAKARLVNNRLSEVACEYPSCKVSHEYIKSENPEEDKTEDVYHLLWSSDRLEVAREIDTRLTKIYADLVALERFMNYKLRWIDVWNKVGPRFDLEKSRKLSIIGQAHKDWIDNAHEASGNRNREEDNPFRSRPGDDLKFIDVLIDDRLHNGSLIPKEKEAEK